MFRRFALVLTLLASVVGSVGVASAQDATPAAGDAGPSAFEGLGLPELRVTIDQNGIQAPSEIEAGRILLTVENQLEFPAGFSIIQLPEGLTIEEALAAFGPPPGAEGEMASPAADGAAEAGASPAAGPGMQLPDWFFEATWAGGAFAPPQGQSQVVIELSAGEWHLLSDPESGLMPVSLNVTGDAATPAATVEIQSDATVELDNFQIRLPEQINAGPQVWEVTNVGDQPHEMFLARTPELLTIEQVQQLLELEEGAPPPPGVPDPAEFQDVGGVAPISQDQTVWAEFNLEPGNYVAVCFMPDEETGMPHAAKGMVVVFQVGVEGEEVAPPASPIPQEGTQG